VREGCELALAVPAKRHLLAESRAQRHADPECDFKQVARKDALYGGGVPCTEQVSSRELEHLPYNPKRDTE
jgi:hypothetical protein